MLTSCNMTRRTGVWERPFFLPPAGCAAMAQVRLVHSI